MNHTKIYTAYLNSPRWEFSNGGLGFVVALLVCLGIYFLRACNVGPTHLYYVVVSCDLYLSLFTQLSFIDCYIFSNFMQLVIELDCRQADMCFLIEWTFLKLKTLVSVKANFLQTLSLTAQHCLWTLCKGPCLSSIQSKHYQVFWCFLCHLYEEPYFFYWMWSLLSQFLQMQFSVCLLTPQAVSSDATACSSTWDQLSDFFHLHTCLYLHI